MHLCNKFRRVIYVEHSHYYPYFVGLLYVDIDSFQSVVHYLKVDLQRIYFYISITNRFQKKIIKNRSEVCSTCRSI